MFAHRPDVNRSTLPTPAFAWLLIAATLALVAGCGARTEWDVGEELGAVTPEGGGSRPIEAHDAGDVTDARAHDATSPDADDAALDATTDATSEDAPSADAADASTDAGTAFQ